MAKFINSRKTYLLKGGVVIEGLSERAYVITKPDKGCGVVILDKTDYVSPPPFSKYVFLELIHFATGSIEFSFNNIMYHQTNGLGMGNPLGTNHFITVANIFGIRFHMI